MTTTLAPATILAVDDTPTNISLLAGLLGEQYKVRAATNGAKALELAAANPPDLILLDIMMPGLSGYDVLERLRADVRLRHIPVIMISAVDEIESVIRCIELGAEDYLPKPFNPTLLRTRVGASLEKKRLRDDIVRHLDQIENELKAAREIQLSMVPLDFRAPTVEHPVEIFATLEPAREIGGDLYDFFWGEDGRLYFVVADVSGKGAPAALFMARIKTTTRLVATLYRAPAGTPVEPGHILERINEDLCNDNRQDMFVTVFFGILDPATGTLSYGNAGHNSPYVLSTKHGASRLGGVHGIPLGITANYEYETSSRHLDQGDCLFVYTDGVTEAMDAESSFFTDQRLEHVLGPLAGAPARAVVSEVIASVRDFAAGEPQADDIAAMAIRLTDGRGP
jgi:sigma-B regulation protein RsbU (phosphoserine phosphatase)